MMTLVEMLETALVMRSVSPRVVRKAGSELLRMVNISSGPA